MQLSPRREKLKEGKHEEYKEKMREAVKKSRMKKKKYGTASYITTRKRVAKYREKQRQIKHQSATCTPDSPKVYKNRNSFGKATKKANRALTNSPRKRKMVVKKLY
ncbi:hypothetical protein JTE90_002574 [Oedothorax gibbosus]|uniref:Uncharacterized protein n=1 Tax=Oedothorax gibbosus TaxID=931172 RepID=A0AAV6TTN3_9ARAC|nr:hypothetical protein JTE90_002574 [Oedothorax gibbosus]